MNMSVVGLRTIGDPAGVCVGAAVGVAVGATPVGVGVLVGALVAPGAPAVGVAVGLAPRGLRETGDEPHPATAAETMSHRAVGAMKTRI